MSSKTKTHASAETSRGSSKPESAAGSSQETPKTRSICEKVVELCTIFQKLKYPRCFTDLLLMEPHKL